MLAEDTFAKVALPYEVANSASLGVDITLMPHPPEVALPATTTELALGDGVYLTVDDGLVAADAIEGPATTASAVRVPTEHWPTLDLQGSVGAVWYLSPIGYRNPAPDPDTAADALPLRLANTDGWPDGTRFDVWLGTYDSPGWYPSGSVTAAGDWLQGDAALASVGTVVLIESSGG